MMAVAIGRQTMAHRGGLLVASLCAVANSSVIAELTAGGGAKLHHYSTTDPVCADAPDGNPAYVEEILDSLERAGKCVAGSVPDQPESTFATRYAGASSSSAQPSMSEAACKNALLNVEDNTVRGAIFKKPSAGSSSGTCQFLSNHHVAAAEHVTADGDVWRCFKKVCCPHTNCPGLDDEDESKEQLVKISSAGEPETLESRQPKSVVRKETHHHAQHRQHAK